MKEAIGAGKFGEVWPARAHGGRPGSEFILKRLFVEKGEAVRQSGLREIYFGQLLRGVPHVCRFVESCASGNHRTTLPKKLCTVCKPFFMTV